MTFQIDEKLKFLQSVSAHVIVIFNNIIRLHKRVIRIITNIRRRNSCREQCKKLQILPLLLQCILCLLLFVINSSDMFEHNCEIHTVNTRNRTNLHLPHLRQQFKKVPFILASRFTGIIPPNKNSSFMIKEI
jgi:hypothetical protein